MHNLPELLALINLYLEPQEIQAKAKIRNDFLHLLLESENIPDKSSAKDSLQGLLKSQDLAEIKGVKVYGRKRGEAKPAWEMEILKPEKPRYSSSESQPEKAKTKPFSSKTKPFSEASKNHQNYWLLAVLSFVSLGLAAFVFTSNDYQDILEELSFMQSLKQISTSLFKSSPSASINNERVFPEEKTSYTLAGEFEDVSYGEVKRLAVRIFIPLGRTPEEVTATLERAASEISNENQTDAVMIFAYRPQDIPSNQYTVGRAVLAPNGLWEEASSSDPKLVSIDLNELYFTTSP